MGERLEVLDLGRLALQLGADLCVVLGPPLAEQPLGLAVLLPPTLRTGDREQGSQWRRGEDRPRSCAGRTASVPACLRALRPSCSASGT